jgi:ABC-2 type transport system ATP-binding protein
VNAIQTDRLVKHYRGASTPALDGVSLSVPEGERFGLLGPNGAGKTTLISILSGALRPSAGTASLLGYDLKTQFGEIRKFLGLVPQELALYDTLTARENLHFFGSVYGLPKKRLIERVSDSLTVAGLESSADRPVKTYSGGMKRRLNLAIGLLHEPRLLILDEPTVGIDAQSRNAILESLEEINRTGTTLLYTTHYMEEAQRLCTRLAIVDRGRVLAEGPTQEVLRRNGNATRLEDLFLELTGKDLKD